MPEIVLSTLNARYIHASFGLRYLMANLGPVRDSAVLLEFDINQRPVEVAESILKQEPKIVGLGVYIWNVQPATELVALLKRIRPDLIVILGGPEVSYETLAQDIVRWADYAITGEADFKFGEICQMLLDGRKPADKVIAAELPDVNRLELPYPLYTQDDIDHRIVYVEASRGCPFSCEFCLSSLDIPVRQFELSRLLDALQGLLARGVQHFKFVDRTFNLNLAVSRAILEFFLERVREGLFVHFEMIPDRLPEALREVIARFPPGALQFEVGIQTFNPEVAALISRRQDYGRLADNLRFLRENTGVHIHADLIAGLPGETFESFADGFDRLVALRPQEIQVGILKRLRGTPIVRHDLAWQMIYGPLPPYEILQNKLIGFATLQKLRRFARFWDLVSNSGNFLESAALIWAGGLSAFHAFMDWTEWCHARTKQSHGIALIHLAELLFEYLTIRRRVDPAVTANAIWADYRRGGRSDMPQFLRPHLNVSAGPQNGPTELKRGRKRQNRHAAAARFPS